MIREKLKFSPHIWGKRLWVRVFVFSILLALWGSAVTGAEAEGTGRGIMEEVFKRHELFPYVYEVQSMILTDSAGNRDVRMIRRFSRIERDGTGKFLLVFDNPEEIRGVALRSVMHSSGQMETDIYLPALGKDLIRISSRDRGGLILGTDFAIDDLITENMADFQYIREADQKIDKTLYFVVSATPKNAEIMKKTGISKRRHFIRKDIYYIVRTDYYGRAGRLVKRLTFHDLKVIDGEMWRANMILMDNRKRKHKTLLKTIKRIFSEDYVSREMFGDEWLLKDRHFLDMEDLLKSGLSPD